MTINTRRLFLSAALLGAMTSGALAGQIYDATADFSLASNPNGVWSYGYEDSLGASLHLYDVANPDWLGKSGLDSWASSVLGGRDPNVNHNRTNADLTFLTVTVPAGELEFHPGPNGQFSVIRWTAPGAGEFNLDAAFRGNDFKYPTTTDVHILLNGNSLFSADILAYAPGPSFSDIISVKSGDTIDFAVGSGPDGNYIGDTTGISAIISAVSEPGGALLLALGVGIVGAIRIGRFFGSQQSVAQSPRAARPRLSRAWASWYGGASSIQDP
jgi:hypothetical protein